MADQRAVTLAKAIAAIDFEMGDYFDFNFGGDGDNGEELILILEEYFRRADRENR